MSEQPPVLTPGAVPGPPDKGKGFDEPIVIPDHQLLRCVGSGSYGEVWLARSVVGTFRAVKIVFRKAFRDHHPFDRELTGIRQFEPISRSHEGFVDVLQIGRNDEAGYFYYIMELGDDEKAGQNFDPATYSPKTLSREISTRGKLPVDECVQLGATLCGALRHLHDYGLIHRDIKPSNIIFVNGAPKLADIGLVANIEEANSYVGTDGFTPPEGPNSFSADLYSLGKVLYEASTGFDRVLFPRMPAKFTSTEDASSLSELNEVLSKACQGPAAKRYQTASEMQADLAILQSGRSVHRVRVLERRWSKAKRMIIAGAGLLVIAALVVMQINRRQKQIAESRQREVGAQVAYGIQDMKEGDFSGALPYFVEALRLDQDDMPREFTHRLRLAALVNRCPKLCQFWSVSGRLMDARFSPDGKNVIIGGGDLEIAPLDPTPQRSKRWNLGPVNVLMTTTMSPDGRLILVASADHRATLRESTTGHIIQTFEHPDVIYDAEFSPDGTKFVTACADGSARIWGIGGGPPIQTFSANPNEMLHAEFNPNGEWLITSGKDNAARLWNIRSGRPFGAPMEHKSWVYTASFSPDGQYVVTAGYDHKARLWTAADGKQFGIAMDHADGVYSARFSPDGRYIVTASFDRTARLWDAKSGAPVKQNSILKHSSALMAASFSPDGSKILTACADGTVRVWDLASSVAVPISRSGTVSPDGRYAAYATNDVIRIEETAPGGRQMPLITCPGVVTNAVFGRDSRFVMALSTVEPTPGQTNTLIGIWSMGSGKLVYQTNTLITTVTCEGISDDGQLLALGGSDNIRVIGLTNNLDVWHPFSPKGGCSGVTFNRSGTSLAIYGANQVTVLDVANGKPRFPTLHLDVEVKYVEFSPKGDVFITCIRDDGLFERSAQLWDTLTGKPVGLPLWHRDGVLHAAFNSTGERVVTTSEDFTAIVWNVRTSEPVTDPLPSGEQVFGASFSKDSRWVVTASFDRTARLWDAQTGDPLSPPLENPDLVSNAIVMEGNNRVVVSGLHGGVWVWELPQDKHSLDELKMLAQILLGNARQSKRGTLAENVRLLQAAWDKLTASHPEDFGSTPAQLRAWHQNEAEAARRAGDPAGVQFHRLWLQQQAP